MLKNSLERNDGIRTITRIMHNYYNSSTLRVLPPPTVFAQFFADANTSSYDNDIYAMTY